MIVKTLEIRDKGTFIPVICIHPVPDNDAQRYLLRRDGYSGEQNEHCIIMIDAQCNGCAYDAYEWTGSRTKQIAHDYIQKNWASLKDGDVVDVQFIIGETTAPKISESLTRMTQAKECCEWNAAIEVAASLMENSGFTYVGTCESGLVASRGGQAATRICAAVIRSLKRAPSHQAGQEGDTQFRDDRAQNGAEALEDAIIIAWGHVPSLVRGGAKQGWPHSADAMVRDARLAARVSATRIEALEGALRKVRRTLDRDSAGTALELGLIDAALADGGG